MSSHRAVLLFLSCGGMELCWLYACTTFLTTAVLHRPFPFPAAIGTFFLAAALYRAFRGKGLRVIAILGLQMMGFFLAASRIIYALNYRAYPYFDKAWMAEFFGKTRDSQEWLITVIIVTFALIFWLAGVAFARRSTAYLSICIRFDYGVTAFFCLFIVKSLLLVKGGIAVRDPAPLLLLFPFFIFSFVAIGLTRNSDRASRHFLAGYRGIGLLVSFTAVILATGAALVVFFMTYLSAAAEAGLGVLKSAAGPLLPVLARILLFLFGKLPEQNAFFPPTDREEPAYIPSGESSALTESLAWGLFGFLVLIALSFCALGVWFLLRWLFSRTSKADRKHLERQRVFLWVLRLWAALRLGVQWAVRRLKGYRTAVQVYGALLKWGRRSGMPRSLSETPGEYGFRLQKQFPVLAGDIGEITGAFNLAAYGEVILDEAHMNRVKSAWKRLRSCRYWPARLKCWFFRV